MRRKIESLADLREVLIAIVKRQKLVWFGHVTLFGGLWKKFMQGTIDDVCWRGQPRNILTADVMEWTSINMPAIVGGTVERLAWRHTSASTAHIFPR